MAAVVYVLCLLTAIVCSAALLTAHRRTRSTLLFWSGMCFALLAVNDLFVLLDIYVIQWVDLWGIRRSLGLLAVLVMLVGLIFHAPEQQP
ncbi:MAG: DUF5985 family protein [Myxococcota bacterium]